MGILVSSAFAVRSMYHTTRGKIPGQLFFGREMILPINHIADWIYIRQCKQTQIDNDVIREKANRIYHNYIVGDKLMTLTKASYKYETPYKVPYKIFQTWKNITVTLIL